MIRRSKSNDATASAPTQAVVMFTEGVSKKDVVVVARNTALSLFPGQDTVKFCILPYRDGWLFEIHEAGTWSKGHLSSIVSALEAGKECAWFRSGGRVLSVSIKDGRPYGVHLPSQAGAALVKKAPELEAKAVDAMQDVVRKGEKVLVAGTAVFMIGTVFLVSALSFDVGTKINVPPPAKFSVVDAPHRQWSKIAQTPKGIYVDALRFDASQPEGRQWEPSRKPIVRDDAGGQPATAAPSGTEAKPQPVSLPTPVPVQGDAQ